MIDRSLFPSAPGRIAPDPGAPARGVRQPREAHATQAGSPFGALVNAGLEQTRGLESRAESTVMGLLRGENVEVHDAMIATQQAELAFELALQVRNKAVAAYQQMMQMQF